MTGNKKKSNSRSGYGKKQFYGTKKKVGTSKAGSQNNSSRKLKFHMHDSALRKNAESFGKVKEAIVLRIQKTFTNGRDLAECLQDGTEKVFNEPILQRAINEDADTMAFQQKMFDMKWQVDYKRFVDQEKEYQENLVKAYALIFESYCSKEVQVAIKELPDYQTHVLDKPLELLIKVEALMHTPQKAIYPLLTLVEILLNMLQVKQTDNEDLVTYLSRFKSERNVMFNLFGKNILDGYVEKTPELRKLLTRGLKK